MRLTPLLATLAVLPTSAFATEYLSVEQAQALMFPTATQFARRDVLLAPALNQREPGPGGGTLASGHLALTLAQQGDLTLGSVVVDEVIGKYERIRYAVALNMDASVRAVEILSYSESHGSEVRLAAWRKQFVGKTAVSTLRLGEDIANISGATLSCTHITDGVRRIVTAVAALRQAGKLV